MLLREQLRRTIVEVLCDQAGRRGPGCEPVDWGLTIANENVFDSPGDPLQILANDSELPAILVYTDDEVAELPNNHADMDLTFVTRLTIVLELYVCHNVSYELESELDVLEKQMRYKLLFDDRFLRPLRKVVSYRSQRVIDNETGTRVGARHCFIEVEYCENNAPEICDPTPFECADLTVDGYQGNTTTDPVSDVESKIELEQ